MQQRCWFSLFIKTGTLLVKEEVLCLMFELTEEEEFSYHEHQQLHLQTLNPR